MVDRHLDDLVASPVTLRATPRHHDERRAAMPGNPVLVAGACAVMGTLIPAGAALAEEAATASAGNAAISALFGAAVVVLTVLTGSVGYLTFVNWQDSRAEKEERRRFEQSEKDRQYQQQMAAYKGDKKRDKERKKATGRGGGSGFGA